MKDPAPVQRRGTTQVRESGRYFVYFGGCDYLRLSCDRRVVQAARVMVSEAGVGVGASRFTTGNHPVYARLEAALARWLGFPSALLTGSGYAAVLVAAQGLAGRFTHVLIDERSHACQREASVWMRVPVHSFRHRDPASVAALVRRLGQGCRPLLMTDGLFAQNGRVAPLRAYHRILPPAGLMLVDDAHGLGILGAKGLGTWELEPVPKTRVVLALTLSKALGVHGGAVVGSAALRARMIRRSPSVVGSSALPPLVAAAALAALRVLAREPGRRSRLWSNVERVREGLRAAGWALPDSLAPVISVELRDGRMVRRLRCRLLRAGIHPPFLRYPGAPAGFRFVISSEHTTAQLDRLVAVLAPFGS